MKREKRKGWIVCALGMLLIAAGLTKTPALSAMGRVQAGVRVPILMYHSVLKNPKMAGMYVVSPDTLEQDLKYIKKKGYTTVFVRELTEYVYQNAPLPEKPVVITLDDGYLNNLTYVLPLLEKYDMKATISVVGRYTEQATEDGAEKPSYSYLTIEEVQKLAESGRVEIGVHSYDMHGQEQRKGAGKRKGESTGAYQTEFRRDTEKALSVLKKSGLANPVVYSYPFGEISEESEPVLREMGFLATLSCRERQNYITKESACLWRLGRYNRPSGISTEHFMEKALEGK